MYVKDISAGLADYGYDVTILTGGEASYTKNDKVKIIVQKSVDVKVGGSFSYRILPDMFSAIKSDNPDIIHVHDHLHNTSLLAPLSKKPLVLQVHSLAEFYNSHPLIRSVVGVYNLFLPSWLRYYRAIIHHSMFSFNAWRIYGRFTPKSYIIPNMIDTNYLDSNLGISLQLQYGILDRPVVFYCGRIERRKGISDLIYAFNYLLKSIPVAVLLISGPDAGEYERLVKLVKSLKLEKSVIFTGRVPDGQLHSTLRKRPVFVVPSVSDIAPNTILKAMHFGCTIVATRVGAIPETLEGCGYLTEPNSPSTLYQALRAAVTRPINPEFVIEASKKFSLENTIPKLSAIYEEVLAS